MSNYDRKDKFYQKAKAEGYPARSAYKLIELNQKYKIFKPGKAVVDLGCAPGGWLKVAQELLGSDSKLVGIDLLPLQYTPDPFVVFIKGDFLAPENQQEIAKQIPQGANWILSDMSPNISGIKFKDLSASLELCEAAYQFVQKHLKKGGGFIIKIFPSDEANVLRKKLKGAFERVDEVLPTATRKTSNEVYWVCLNYKAGPQ